MSDDLKVDVLYFGRRGTAQRDKSIAAYWDAIDAICAISALERDSREG